MLPPVSFVGTNGLYTLDRLRRYQIRDVGPLSFLMDYGRNKMDLRLAGRSVRPVISTEQKEAARTILWRLLQAVHADGNESVELKEDNPDYEVPWHRTNDALCGKYSASLRGHQRLP